MRPSRMTRITAPKRSSDLLRVVVNGSVKLDRQPNHRSTRVGEKAANDLAALAPSPFRERGLGVRFKNVPASPRAISA